MRSFLLNLEVCMSYVWLSYLNVTACHSQVHSQLCTLEAVSRVHRLHLCEQLH